MPKPPMANVIAHWSKLVENFQTSTLDYYAAVEAALAQRQIPGIKTSRVDFREGSAVSARREYLRVTRKDLAFDLCGAPFGTGFFFSSWLIEKPPSRIFLYVSLLLALIWIPTVHHVPALEYAGYVLTYPLSRLGSVGRFLWRYRIALLLPLAIWLLGWSFGRFFEQYIVGTPGIGTLYLRLFRRRTYYQLDTMLMFRAATQAAMLEVIDGLTGAKGLRALSDDERRPIMRDFFRR